MDQVLSSGKAITLVHLVYQGPAGKWCLACMPNMTEFGETMSHPCYHRTDDTRAVSCPACRATPTYQRMHAIQPR